MIRFTRFAPTLAAVAGLTLAGCGSGTSSATLIRNGGPKTIAQHTAALSFSVASDASGSMVTSTGDGSVDFVQKVVRGTFTVNGVPGVPDGSKADGIFEGQFIYAHLLGAAAKSLPIPTPWIKVDLRALANIPGLDLGTISLAHDINPNLFFLFERGVTNPVTVGKESVAGTATTHYKVTIDLNKAVKGLTGDDATTINKDLAAYTTPTFPAEFWIDGPGVIRKATFTATIKGAKGKPDNHETVTVTFPSFGAPVDTSLPPADQTSDLTSLLSSLANG
jgi:hypothetical protein